MKKLLAFLAAVLLLAGCAADREQPAGTDAEASLAQSAMTKERWTDTDGTALDYWLYTPKNPAEDMPLIVYLHGGSGKGNDLEKNPGRGQPPRLSLVRAAFPGGLCADSSAAGKLQGLDGPGGGVDEADLPCGSRLRH